MREMKFRAWDKEDKRMIVDEQNYVPLIVTNKGVMKLNPHHKENLWSILDENRFIIMQYTGSKDMYKEDLYEGDITIDEWDNITVICWNDRYGAFATVPTEVYLNETPPYEFHVDWLFSNNVPSIYLKIIGNIYENPELLQL